MNDIAISVKNISKSYRMYPSPKEKLKELLHPFGKKYHKEFWALKDISFDIKKGECVGIIGRNGSGKSTLLQIICGVLQPTTGEATVRGRISALLELGAGFNREFSGRDNVYMNGALMGISKDEMDEKFESIANFADIGDFIEQPAKTYSSGMYVRLAFACAVNVEPDILIVDEALAVGDMNFQAKCYKKFQEFQESGQTILFVTHSIDNVIRYCNKGILLSDGNKLVEDTPKEAVDSYKRLMADCYKQESPTTAAKVNARKLETVYKYNFSINKDALIYGNMKAEIVDFGIFDKAGKPAQKLFGGEACYVKMKVKFNEAIENPIFAYTIKDIKGLELTGTNSNYKNISTSVFKENHVVEIEFSQILNLQTGIYALSLGCTNFEADNFVVYHRVYDIILFEVINPDKFVGFFDLKSEIAIYKS